MEAIPKIIRDRLEAMSLADLDVLADTCGRAATQNPTDRMRIRVTWISTIITEKIIAVFNTTTNEDEVIASN